MYSFRFICTVYLNYHDNNAHLHNIIYILYSTTVRNGWVVTRFPWYSIFEKSMDWAQIICVDSTSEDKLNDTKYIFIYSTFQIYAIST